MNVEQTEAAKKLLSTIEVVNETVGDAISDMFLVEIILQSNGWDVKDWYNTYVDLPNSQRKICVRDRNVITTTDAERKVVTPEGLQAGIDELVAKYPRARSFVRPSGTEDIVRVYAEATTKEVTRQIRQHFHQNLFKIVSILIWNVIKIAGCRMFGWGGIRVGVSACRWHWTRRTNKTNEWHCQWTSQLDTSIENQHLILFYPIHSLCLRQMQFSLNAIKNTYLSL